MANSTTTALVALLALSLFVNVLQFASDTSHACVCPSCEKTICPDCSNSQQQPKDDGGGGDGGGAVSPDHDGRVVGKSHSDGGAADSSKTYNGEEGWYLGTERVARKTDNTVYDPKEDAAVASRTQAVGGKYSKSPVPRGSWRVRVGGNRWVTMDDAVFAYDVWFDENQVFQYMSWLGVYVQQDPADAFVIQQMLWQEKPDLVIEIGTNTGGGAVFYASIMKYYNPDAKVVTLDVKAVSNWNKRNNDRCENCMMGDQHPIWKDGNNIHFIQGRVTEEATRKKVDAFVEAAKKVIVIEDASHRYPDTLQNMEAIHQWVSVGSYMLVQDTKMDRFVAGLKKKYGRHKYGPMRSVDEFIKKHSNFVVDRKFEYLLYSQHHRGWLKKKSAR